MPLDGKPGFGVFRIDGEPRDHLAGGVILTTEKPNGAYTVRIRVGTVTVSVTVK
jgi:hypothetical protein